MGCKCIIPNIESKDEINSERTKSNPEKGTNINEFSSQENINEKKSEKLKSKMKNQRDEKGDYDYNLQKNDIQSPINFEKKQEEDYNNEIKSVHKDNENNDFNFNENPFNQNPLNENPPFNENLLNENPQFKENKTNQNSFNENQRNENPFNENPLNENQRNENSLNQSQRNENPQFNENQRNENPLNENPQFNENQRNENPLNENQRNENPLNENQRNETPLLLNNNETPIEIGQFNKKIATEKPSILKEDIDKNLNENSENKYLEPINENSNNKKIQEEENDSIIETPEDDFSKYIFEHINHIRKNPKDYIQIIEESKNNIQDRNNKLIYKSKVKVALYKGLPVFNETISFLEKVEPMDELKFKSKLCIPAPLNEQDIKNKNYLKENVEKLKKNGNNIGAYWRDIINDPETNFILMIVDDNGSKSGYKRSNIFNPRFKYIGINSVKIEKSFACYITLSESKPKE